MCVDENSKPIQSAPYYLQGRYLRENRLKWGWTLRDAAKIADMSIVEFSECERGIRQLSNRTMGIFSDPNDKTMPSDAELKRRFAL